MTVSEEIQKLLLDTLKANVAVMGLVNGVWDKRPIDATAFAEPKLACITFGPTDITDDYAECIDGETHTVQLDVWSRTVGAIGCKRIVDTVRKALNRADLILATNAMVETKVVLTRVFDDPDGVTTHGVLSIEMMVEVA